MTKDQLNRGKILELSIKRLEMLLAEIECGADLTVGAKHEVWFCDDELKEVIVGKLEERLNRYRKDFDEL